MPKMTGTALAKKIFAAGKHIPVILTSGTIKKMKDDNVSGTRICGYLKKTWNERALAVLIRNILDEDHVPKPC